MVKKINLWSFEEYEKFFIEEEDIIKTCVFTSLLFENWPFKFRKNRHWTKIIRKIMKRIDSIYEEHFENGFQHKVLSVDNKVVLSVLFSMIQRIYGFVEEPPVVKLQDRILKFAFCFDLDVIFMSYSTIFMIGEPISISRTLPVHLEIFYKLAGFDIAFNDSFPHIKDKIYKPVPFLVIKNSPIDAFWDSSAEYKFSDTYVTVLKNMLGQNEQFNTILKQNTIMILFSTLNSNEYYHRLSISYDMLDLEKDREFIKNLNVENLLEESRRNFTVYLRDEGILDIFNDLYYEAYQLSMEFNKREKINYEIGLSKHLSYVRDLGLELKWSFERYLIFCAGYDLNIVHLIFILELGEFNGIFYNTLENALRNPEYEKLNVFTLFESLLRLENQTVLNWEIILDYALKYLEGKNDDTLQCFLKNILISTKENEDCFLALLKGNCVENFCEYLNNKDINEKNDIFIVLIDILFHLYKKQNTKLEPFEESKFSWVCLHLIDLKDNLVSIRCFNILSYFINADPLSIETLEKLGISNVLENVKDSTCNEQLGICLINFIDALSLNIQYAQKLRDEFVFSSILSSLNIYDIDMPLLPDGSLIETISVFLRHHPEYNGEYTLFCLNRFEQMVETYKSRTPSENEIRAVENFLESFSHLKSNTSLDKDNYKEKMVKLLVELYSHVSIYDNQPVSSVFTVYQMFVSILGFLNNGRSAVQFVVPKLENVVNEIKEFLKARVDDKKIVIEEEYKMLMLKGEKLISLISGIINNFVSGKSMNRTLLENIMKYSLDLFLLTIDHINGMYDHDVMGGSFISSYLDLGSKFNKGQNDSKENYKLSSLLICLNNVFLLKYSIEEYDTGKSVTSETFLSKYLDLISECLQKDNILNKGKKKRVKSYNMNKQQIDKILVLSKVLQHLSEYFDRGMLQMFCLWIKKHELFKEYDFKIKEIVLQILSSSVYFNIENEYKKIIIEFLQTFTTRSGEISGMILSTITNFYGHEKKLDIDSEPLLASLVSKHYWSGCTYRCKFLMNSIDFIIHNIKEENYNIFVDSITEDTLCYFVLLINFHYDDMMFNLLKCILETSTFVKKKLDKEKLNTFIQRLRENHLFDVKYCLDDDDIMKKMVDKEGFLQINLDLVLEQLNNEITKSYTEVTPMNWGFFLACEKYCEVRAGKFGVLSDTNLLNCCMFANCYEICLFPMLIIHSIFSNMNDLYELKNKILDKKDALTFYGLENDNYDYFPLAWRNPDIIFMKKAPKVDYNIILNVHDSSKNNHLNTSVCYSILMEFAFKHPNFLFILSEIVHNYTRYISILDLDYIKKISATYLGSDLSYVKDSNKQIGAKRALEFFSICVHSHDPEFMKIFIMFIKSLLNGTVNEICNAIIILCNISNPLNTLTSSLEHGVKDKSIYLSLSEFLKNDILDLFISVISKIDEKELPNLKELSDNSETLISNLGMKNPNFFLIQNHLVSINSYDISDFNSNSLNNSHDDLLNIGLNFIYNFLYTIYQKEIEDSGICDIEISEDDIEDDFDSTETFYNENATDNESSSTIYNETEDEEIFEDIEDVVIDEESKTSEESNVDAIPMIRSIYLRFETAYKTLDEENMRLIFENISNLVSKIENDPESESGQVSTVANIEDEENENIESIIEDDQIEDNEDSEESSIGVYDGFIPNKSPDEVNEMTENEFNDYVSSLMNERKANNLDYKPIDRNYLNELVKPYRYAFERYESHLKDFYYPEFEMFLEKDEEHEKHQIILPLSEKTVIKLVKAFYNGKFTGKPQIYNIFKIMSLCAGTRDILLTEAIYKLVKEVKDLHVDSYDFDNIKKSIEIVRIMTLKFEIRNENEKVDVVRSLFKLLQHKSVAIKSLHLLNKINFGNEIFGFTDEVHDFDNILIKRKKLIVSEVLKLSKTWINKKTTIYLKNVIKKICGDTADILATSIIRNITNKFLHILSCGESMMLQKYIEVQSKILNLILLFDICFSSFFESFRNEYKEVIESFFANIGMEYKNIENVDFKYLYNYYKHSQGLMSGLKFYQCSVIGRTLSRNILDSLYYLIKDGIERAIRKLSKEKSSVIDYYYMSGLYNVYILIFSIYEGLINHFCIFGTEKKDIILKQFDDLRNDLSLFLDSNMNEINTIFSVEQDVFTQNIRFLSRFNVINFVNKHNYFRGKIQDFNLYKEGTYTINVRRGNILSDSLFQIMNKTSKEFKAKRLQVKFSVEEGLDFGGITREWVDLLVKDLTMPDKGLFVYTSEKKTTFLPYRNSKVNPDHLLYFRFVGRILAKSILDRITLDLHIDKSVYKYFLGKKCELSDLEPIDPQFHNSLIWMRDSTIQDVIFMTFSFEYLEFGEMRIVDLKPDGRNILVTDENKQDYIDLIVDYKLFKGIEMQLNSIKSGLFEIIDRDMLSIFNENEFELLINGIPDINVDDWMNNTEYHGYKNNSTNVIWFWKAVKSFSPEERAKLLQFSTGSSRVPFEGFSHLQGNNGPQKFSIHKSSSDNVRLPSAHTCFNQLDLPEYPSFSDLRKSLIYAINECPEGFGLI